MPTSQIDHPTTQQLTQFTSGKLNSLESGEIERHLAACESCCQLLKTLPDDTLVSLLRGESDTTVEGKSQRESQFAPTILPQSAHATIPPSAHQTVAVEAGNAALTDLPAGLRDHPRYRVISLLGQGGMGSVYQAEHRMMKRSVALKVINPQLVQNTAAIERFHREVQAAAKLAHPNIVAAYDAEQAADAHFLVMEFVPGEDLAAVVHRHGRLPIETACEYVRQAALGLAHAQGRGMVHRDIKPQNLMLTSGGQVKILDFGLAQFASEIAEVSGLTQMGAIMGTPDYMAPEQARDAHSADIRADIYSLGCTLYYLLTGSTPYTDDSTLGKIMAHAERDPTPLVQLIPGIPAGLARIVRKMMAKKPDQRYQTPAEVAEALAPFAAAASSPLPAKPALPSSTPISPWAPIAIIASIALALLGGLGAVIVVATSKGQVEIQSEVDDVEIVVKQGGKEITIIDTTTGSQVKWLPSGKYEVELKQNRNDLEINRKGFTLSRLGKEIVTLKRKADGEAPVLSQVASPPKQFPSWLEFDGRNSYVAIPSLVRDDPAQPLTLETWVQAANDSRTGVVVTIGGMARCQLHRGSESWHGLGAYDGLDLMTPLTKEEFAHLALVTTTNEMRLYLDGKLAQRGSLNSNRPLSTTGRKQSEIGGHESFHGAGLTGFPFAGKIAGVRVSKSALYDKDFTPPLKFSADANTLALYSFDEGQGNILRDSSGNNHHGKIVGAKWSSTDPTTLAKDRFARERQAAEWVLQIGATPRINFGGVERLINKREELPDGDWHVTEVGLDPLRLHSTATLEKLAGLQKLRWLRLFATQISDEGLSELTDVPQLTYLDLDHNNAITDKSLEHIGQHLGALETLGLHGTSITDDGLAHLGKMKQLSSLNLAGTHLDGSGLSQLKSLSALKYLSLNATAVTNESLAHLNEFPALEHLELRQTKINDDAVVHLARLSKLKRLAAPESGISLAGMEKLRTALPRCFIDGTSAEALQLWNRTVASATWSPLEPVTLTANNGTTLKRLDDQSILAEGPNPGSSTYTIFASAPLKRVTALRLDVLQDDRLPEKGPGRAQNGTFVLTGVSIRIVSSSDAAPRTVALRRSFADYAQETYEVANLATGGDKAGWAIMRSDYSVQNQSLILDLAEPLILGEGAMISVTLRHQSEWPQHNLGRFRLAATDADREPLAETTAKPAQDWKGGSNDTPLPAVAPFDNPAVKNLVVDPSLEETAIGEKYPQGWGSGNLSPAGAYTSTVIEGGRTGEHGWQVAGDGKFAVIPTNRVPVDRTRRYGGRVWVRINEGTAQLKILYFDGSNRYIGENVGAASVPGDWQMLSIRDDLAAHPTAERLSLAVSMFGKAAAVFDDFELQAFDSQNLPADFDKQYALPRHDPALFDRWVGQWQTEAEFRPTAGIEAKTVKGEAVVRKVLDDQFLLTQWSAAAEDSQSLSMLGFDENLKAYRFFMFSSSGEAYERLGMWDGSQNRLSLSIRPPARGVSGLSVDRFLAPDQMESTLLIKNSQGIARDLHTKWTRTSSTIPEAYALDAAPVAEPKELTQLEPMLGRWAIDAQIKPCVWFPEGKTESTTEIASWICGGRLLLTQGFDEKQQPTTLAVTVYEQSERAYRYWLFSKTVYGGQWQIAWEEMSRTFHMRATDMPEGWSGNARNRLLEDGQFACDVLIKDEQGRVLLEMTQTKKR